MMVAQHGGGRNTRVVDQFEATDLGAPFKVILHKSVKVTFEVSTGDMVSYAIPDLDGLIRTVVITRLLNSRKLSGGDIKFVRKGIGVKAKDLAHQIEVTPEHISRCEAGTLVMSPTSEKLLRIFALKTVFKLHKTKSCEAKTRLEDALDELFDVMKPVSVHSADDVLELHFYRSSPSVANGNDNVDDPNGEWDGTQPAEAA